MGRHHHLDPWSMKQDDSTMHEDDGGRRGRGGPRRGPHGHGPGRGEWGGRRGRPGPPPWLAGLFGLDDGDQRRGPRVRRGDVRSAILDVLRTASEAEEQVNGYQVIQAIAERTGEAWKPSPGSVYPTIQQLQDEGLVAADDEHGRRALSLTADGRAFVAERADELAAVWAPFERREQEREAGRRGDLKPEIGQVVSAVWQITTTGSERQRAAAVEVLVDTRRRLYGILADGDEGLDETDGEG